MRKKAWRCAVAKRKRSLRERAVEPGLIRANQEWATGFIVDELANGPMVRILSVVVAFTRECLGAGSRYEPRQQIDERGVPESVRSDNGLEFTSRRMLGGGTQGQLVHIQLWRPMQNGHVESFPRAPA
jgi:transposase InsO family protein